MASNRLFDHDRRVATNAARATFAGWHDRLLATALILVALAAARAWALDRSWPVAAWTGLAAGVVIGLTIARRLAARLAFHGFDGVLAADALQPHTQRRYLAAWHLTALALVAGTTLIARPALLIVTVPGYLFGVVAEQVIGMITLSTAAAGQAATGRALRTWVGRPLAGPAASTLLILSMPLLAASAGDLAIILVGFETAMLALLLASIDDGIVRAMTMAGWTAWRVVAHHARGTLLFAGIATPIAGLTLGAAGVIVVVAVSGGALALMTMRVLTYRLYHRRAADLIVSILAAVLILVGVTMTIALPLIALVVFWHLHRRAAAATWLIA